MKRLALFLCLVPNLAFAKASIRIPLYTAEGVYLTAYNDRIERLGLEPFPEFFEVSSDEDGEKAAEKFAALQEKVRETTKHLNDDIEIRTETIPNAKAKGTCYTGKAGDDVAKAIFNLTDTFYTEQMNLWGWRYKQDVGLSEDGDEDTLKVLEKRSKIWREWRGQGEAMLFVFATSDDGDDMNVSVLKRCSRSTN